MKTIPLTQGKEMLVDDADYEWMIKYGYHAYFHHGTWYAKRGECVNGKMVSIRAHREILGLVPNDGKITDHIDGNGLNNQRSNLRITNNTGNTRNSKIRHWKRFKGVTRVWMGNRSPNAKRQWKARITVDRKVIYLGDYETQEDAARAYNEAAKKYHGDFARLNIL